MKVAEKTHARLGPSGYEWWSNCPGAPALCDGLPNNTSAYAAEGSVAHEIADQVLTGELADASVMLDTIVSYEGYDILVDQEMVDSVNGYVDTVRAIAGEDGLLLPEQSLPIGHLTGETGATGTTDAIVIKGNRMTVIDLKYGKGVRVDAEGNGQGRMYALGALHQYGMIHDIDEVEIMIIQPRVDDGVTSEVLSIGELEEFKDLVELAAGTVAHADSISDTPEFDGYLTPGDKQCRFCSAKAICPALKAKVDTSLALVSTCSVEDFADLTMPKQAATVSITPDVPSEKLAEFLRAVPLIEAAISGVRAEVERRLFADQDVPGFYLGEGKKGNRAWSSEAEAKKAIVKRGRLTKEQAYESKLISPTKAEKLLGKDTIKLLTNEGLIKQPEGKPSVCQIGDKNPPYKVVTAESFADLSAQSEAERLLG